MTTYKLRFRFHISHKGMITGENKEFEFSLPNGHLAIMHCIDADKFSDSTKFVVVSGKYLTEEDAFEYAIKIKDAVLCFGAKYRMGIDVGKNKAIGHLSKHIKEEIFDGRGIRIIDDVHGITVYSEDRPTSCFSFSLGRIVNSRDINFFSSEVCNILSVPTKFDSQVKLAMELLTSSFFESSPRARFLTLVLASESLLSPDDRPLDVKNFIDELKEHTKASEISKSDKCSILGSLNWLYKDSISQSLRKMASKHLEGKVYDGLEPEKFIIKCYKARSKLVHTGNVKDSRYNIGNLAANLEVYMADMLTNITCI